MKARLHSIETFGAVDGPGIRTVFFMQGCPARCLYCHNPDSWKCDGGREADLDEIMYRAERGIPYYGDKGGVTFSGGECMLQINFLTELLKECKKNGINTAVDTAGNVQYSYFEAILPYTDIFLYDIILHR